MAYKVTVHPDHRWSDAQIAGRIFSKRTELYLNAADVTDELRRAALPDEENGKPPILVIEADENEPVEVVEVQTEPDAEKPGGFATEEVAEPVEEEAPKTVTEVTRRSRR